MRAHIMRGDATVLHRGTDCARVHWQAHAWALGSTVHAWGTRQGRLDLCLMRALCSPEPDPRVCCTTHAAAGTAGSPPPDLLALKLSTLGLVNLPASPKNELRMLAMQWERCATARIATNQVVRRSGAGIHQRWLRV